MVFNDVDEHANVQETMQRALTLHKNGALAEAESLYQRVLSNHPQHIDANCLLGTIFIQTRRYHEGIELLEQTLSIDPNHVNAEVNLGFAFHELGQTEKAIEHYQRALEKESGHLNALNNLGSILREQTRFDDAQQCFLKALAVAPDFFRAHLNIGHLYVDQNRLDQALSHYQQAIDVNPTYVDAINALGHVLRKKGDDDAAAQCFKKTLNLDSCNAVALCQLGVIEQQKQNLEGAIKLYRQSLSFDPNDTDTLTSLGAALLDVEAYGEAIETLRRAVTLQPSLVEAWLNLSLAFYHSDRIDEGIEAAHRAIDLAPHRPDVHNSLGLLLSKIRKRDEAKEAFFKALELEPNYIDALVNLGAMHSGGLDEILSYNDRVLALDPNHALAHWNRALVLLKMGRLEEAWEEYEWGMKTKERRVADFPHAPRWQGESLSDKTVFVVSEQGVGDELLFASCLPDLIAQAKTCVVQCSPRFQQLYERAFPQAVIYGKTRDGDFSWLQEHVDYHIHIGSLPRYFRKTFQTFDRNRRYIKANDHDVQAWRGRLNALGAGIKVGISWRSSLTGLLRDEHYTEIKSLYALFEVPGVQFVNLQCGECGAELAQAKRDTGVAIHQFTDVDLYNDFNQAAALYHALDLVISPATFTYILAASMGVPVWLFATEGGHFG